MKRRLSFLIIFLLFFLEACNKKNQSIDLKVTLIKSIGVETAKNKEEEPYQFSSIFSIDCDDEGNIYVLDSKENCVKVFGKNGKFLKKLFREGRGPEEIINAYKIKVNKFTGNLFVLQEHGYQFKEFDTSGKYIKAYPLSEQIMYYFDFIDPNRILYVFHGRPRERIYKNFKILNLKTLKIEKEFAPTDREFIINALMRFVVIDRTLWTSPGDEMRLVAYDLDSGKKIKSIEIKESYKKSKILWGGPNWITVAFYNCAQPIILNKRIYVLVRKIEYFSDRTVKDLHPPKSQKFFLYLLDKEKLIKLKELEEISEKEYIFLQTVWKNRLIFLGHEPYPVIKILEINEK